MDRIEPDEAMKAWLAGFFDGEGCIEIRERYHHSPNQLSPYHILRISIGNTSKPILNLIAIYFGGSVGSGYLATNRANRQYEWTANSKTAKAILEEILPYLKLKRPQAELAIAFQDRLTKGKYKHVGKRLDRSEIQLRQLYKAIVHRLKEPEMVDYYLEREMISGN